MTRNLCRVLGAPRAPRLSRPSAGGGILLAVALAGAGCSQDPTDRPALEEGRRAGISWPAVASSSVPQELPEGVTRAMVAAGERIFSGEGFCFNCHGRDARGVPNLGSDLTDAVWAHTDGTYEGLIGMIGRGVSAESSSSGVPMPPRGGARLTDPQLKAVAAYVWTLSR